LSWSARLDIATDAAAGLAYLHSSDNKPVILHRDIKSSNILLDDDNRARISDVGLSRPMEAAFSQTVGLGTFGYMDSGYLVTGEFTPPSDVFSLGVVLLELLTGEAAADSTKRPPLLHACQTMQLWCVRPWLNGQDPKQNSWQGLPRAVSAWR
jgi:serine/threonine protein kinase